MSEMRATEPNRVIVATHTVKRRYLIPKGFDAKRLIDEKRVFEIIDDKDLIIESLEKDSLCIQSHHESRSQETLTVEDAEFENPMTDMAVLDADEQAEEYDDPLTRWDTAIYSLPSDQPYFRTDAEIESKKDPYKSAKNESLRRLIKGYEKMLEEYKGLTPEIKKMVQEGILMACRAMK